MKERESAKKKAALTIAEMAVFAMLAALMYASKVLMDLLPNVHLLGVFVVAETIVYRKKALYPLYIFVLLTGLINGFALWWIPYLYIWTILWAMAMCIPKKASAKKTAIAGMLVCSLHGFLYGTLYAPAQALLFHLNLKGMLSWIAAGFPFDAVHGLSNLVCGVLIAPLAAVLKKLNNPRTFSR